MNMMHAGGIGGQENLASVMIGNGGGNSDEFIHLIMSTKDGKDKNGRLYGYFGATYKGNNCVQSRVCQEVRNRTF